MNLNLKFYQLNMFKTLVNQENHYHKILTVIEDKSRTKIIFEEDPPTEETHILKHKTL